MNPILENLYKLDSSLEKLGMTPQSAKEALEWHYAPETKFRKPTKEWIIEKMDNLSREDTDRIIGNIFRKNGSKAEEIPLYQGFKKGMAEEAAYVFSVSYISQKLALPENCQLVKQIAEKARPIIQKEVDVQIDILYSLFVKDRIHYFLRPAPSFYREG